MDEAHADALLTKLIQLGLLEERDHDIHPTRRWNARVQAAAERINLDAEKHGTPDANPLVLAVALALQDEKPPLATNELDDAIRMLVTLELTRMNAEKRARYGF